MDNLRLNAGERGSETDDPAACAVWSAETVCKDGLAKRIHIL
ncbi:hypothetical protein BSIN_4793 [Burkholderia singularis]|uniref:Uncharacterized protein n=1 Tax=Burkholderia singularis TaxID=1503053 RepID=A0A238HAH0_9BURK|nr:hypothetical protein BSIN_4793 [Burkholderia singularis]